LFKMTRRSAPEAHPPLAEIYDVQFTIPTIYD
jgi:hypothetical protein